MHLVEVFLPQICPNGDLVPEAVFELIEMELAEAFGGITEYARGSARGLWSQDGQLKADLLVILEIMVKDLDKDWWKDFQHRTRDLLRQEELLIRTSVVERL